MTKDLDMSDVIADAEAQFDRFLYDLQDESRTDLEYLRYRYGPDARQGEPHGIAVITTINYILSTPCVLEFGWHDEHSDCQRMLDTMDGDYGDPDSWYADAYNREREEEMLGRPLFPNEY